jgi:hypothetical protein
VEYLAVRNHFYWGRVYKLNREKKQLAKSQTNQFV